MSERRVKVVIEGNPDLGENWVRTLWLSDVELEVTRIMSVEKVHIDAKVALVEDVWPAEFPEGV